MNDGVTRAILNTGVTSGGGSNAPQIKLLEIPASLQKQNIISGEVIANKDGKITLKTPQGNVVFEADVVLSVGQKVSLKLQVVMQNAEKALLVELTTIAGQPISKPQSQPATTQPQAPLPPPLQALPVMPDKAPAIAKPLPALPEILPAMPDDVLAAFPVLQTKFVELPKAISQEAIAILLKEVLNLPNQQALPPTLREGLEKIRQLLPLLLPFNPTTAPIAAPQATISEQNVLLSLMQLIQGTQANAPTPEKQPSLASWPLQNLSLLQHIKPGEGLSRDIMAALVNQLQTITSNKASPPSIVQPGQPLAAAPIPAPETLLAAPSVQPLAALVLGQKQIPGLPQAMAPTLLMSFMPNTQQAFVFVTAMQKSFEAQPLLPGSVLILAMPQQAAQSGQGTQQTVMPLPFSVLLEHAASVPLLPLHPAIGDTWPALQELWTDILAQATAFPDMAAAMRQTMPAPLPQHMPPAMLFFLAVLRQGALNGWFGETSVDQLKQIGKAGLLGQLSNDLQAIRNALSDGTAAPDVWRPLPVPLQIGTELVRMQWFFRHQYDDPSQQASSDDQENGKRRKTRFIVDVPKTRLGDIQIDGLMQEKNLDVILRTENTIASSMETAIRDRYVRALETTGLNGAISFQAGRQQYVHV